MALAICAGVVDGYCAGATSASPAAAAVFNGATECRVHTLCNLLIGRGSWVPAYAGKTKIINKSVFL